MTALVLGVVDIGYVDDGKSTTTGDVAEHLENKYHVMRTFAEINDEFITQTLTDQYAGLVESIAMGAPVSMVLKTKLGGREISGLGFGGKIEERFRDFLDSGQMAATLPATQQIAAAAKGVNSRKKAGVNKGGKSRQAFVDTGLYQASFRAYIA